MRFSVMLLVSVVAMFAYQQLSAQSTTTATIVRPYITEISPKNLITGVDSTVVTIRGGRFDSDVKVFLNGRSVRVRRMEGDSLIVVVIGRELTAEPDLATLLIENPNFTQVGLRIAIIPSLQIPCRRLDTTPGNITVFPSSTAASTSAFRLQIGGANITPNTRVFWETNELEIETRTNVVVATVPARLNTSGTFIVSLIDSSTPCSAFRFIIQQVILPTLWITTVRPAELLPYGGRITIFGAGFSTLATVQLGGVTLATISISTNQIIAVVPPSLGAGNFVLRVTNPDGQSAYQSYLIVVNGVNSFYQSLALSPNPAHNTLTFTTTLNRASHLRCTLRTTLGAVVMEERHVAAAGELSTALDVSAFPSGIYFLEVSDDAGGRWMQKVVKY